MRSLQWLLALSLILLNGCTYSITMVHTAGSATDVVDSTSTPSADIKITPEF